MLDSRANEAGPPERAFAIIDLQNAPYSEGHFFNSLSHGRCAAYGERRETRAGTD